MAQVVEIITCFRQGLVYPAESIILLLIVFDWFTLEYCSKYRQISKVRQITKLKSLSSGLAVAITQSIEARC